MDRISQPWVLPAIGALLGFFLGLGVGASRGASSEATVANPRDAVSMVPPGVRGMLLIDAERLRSAPSLRRFFLEPRAGDPCELRIARRVHHATVVFQETDLSDLAIALTGNVERDELGACVRSRAGSLQLDLVRALGTEFVVARRENDPALVALREEFSAALLPSGTILAGANSMVLRLSEHARAGGATLGTVPLRSLRDRLGRSEAAVEFAALLPERWRDSGPAGPLLQHVRGVAAALSVQSSGLEIVLVLACDDFDAPRALADALDRLRQDVSARVRLDSVAAPLRNARVERGASEVRVRVRFSSSEAEALTVLLGPWMRALGGEGERGERPDAG